MASTGRERQTTASKLSPYAVKTSTHVDAGTSIDLDIPGFPPIVRSTNVEVHKRLANYAKMKEESGFNLTESIRIHKDFGNPKVNTTVN
jgi:hypothetical protein